mgnify:CR=1 FL=1
MNASADHILQAEGLSKQFRGFYAVKDVNLNVRRHSIHALIGPNGAGKTTCFNLLSTFLKPTAGSIRFNGRRIEHSDPATVADSGLVRSFQISAVFGQMTVLENVRVALQRKTRWNYAFWRNQQAAGTQTSSAFGWQAWLACRERLSSSEPSSHVPGAISRAKILPPALVSSGGLVTSLPV